VNSIGTDCTEFNGNKSLKFCFSHKNSWYV